MTGVITTVIKVYVDGACPGNRGPGAIGVIILDENNNELKTFKEPIGDTTNNQAEYHALIRGLELAAGICRRRVICLSDSELVIRQVNRQYRIRNAELLNLCCVVEERARLFDEVVYQHVSKTNQYLCRADKLAKEALSG